MTTAGETQAQAAGQEKPVNANYVSPKYLSAEDKKVHVAYILMIFFGIIGVHKFYLGRVGFGILYILTLGILGIGVLVDVFTLHTQTVVANQKADTLR